MNSPKSYPKTGKLNKSERGLFLVQVSVILKRKVCRETRLLGDRQLEMKYKQGSKIFKMYQGIIRTKGID